MEIIINQLPSLLSHDLSSICVLIVDPSIIKLSDAADQLINNLDVYSVHIGKELSDFLRNEPATSYTRNAITWFQNRLGLLSPGPVVIREIDLLFEPSLKLDPLALFRQASRVTKLVVLWPGDFKSGTLSYAVPEHRHYRTWRITDGNINIYRLED